MIFILVKSLRRYFEKLKIAHSISFNHKICEFCEKSAKTINKFYEFYDLLVFLLKTEL